MNELIWMFPILFMVHDMEEIIGFGLWLTKNESFLDERYPKISNTYKPYSTEGMAAAVMEELVLCLGICVHSRWTAFYGLWFGAFMAYTIHLIVHIGQSLIIRKYIPALLTSVLCLPVSIWVIWKSMLLASLNITEAAVYSVIGIVVIVGNLKVVHWIIHAFTRKTFLKPIDKKE